MAKHVWMRRPAFVEKVRRSSGWNSYVEHREWPAWDQCQRCGMSRGMAEHIDAGCRESHPSDTQGEE